MRALILFSVCLLGFFSCGSDGEQTQVDDVVETGTVGKGDEFTPSDSVFPIDRMGHVEVGPLIIADMPTADAFNQETAYGLDMSVEDREFYATVLHDGLIRYDNFDSLPMRVFDWDFDFLEQIRADRENAIPDPTRLDWIDDLDQQHPLVGVYLTDALYIDLEKPCGDQNYLEPELAVVRGEEPQTCGGRTINEDVLDVFATVLINGPVPRSHHPDDEPEADDDSYPDRGDSVAAPSRPASNRFPYIAKPYSRFLFN